MKVREQLSDYIATAGVMSPKAVTEQLFADSVAPGGGVHGTNSPRPGGVKNPYVAIKDLLRFLVDP